MKSLLKQLKINQFLQNLVVVVFKGRQAYWFCCASSFHTCNCPLVEVYFKIKCIIC